MHAGHVTGENLPDGKRVMKKIQLGSIVSLSLFL